MNKIVATTFISVFGISLALAYYYNDIKASLYKIKGYREYMHDFYKNDLDEFPN